MVKIKSIDVQIHDTGFGGYPYKAVVMVEIPSKEFNKLCPVVSRSSGFFATKINRDLGGLVLDVNNMVYKINQNIPSYNPSIDSKGDKRSKNGIKTLEFVYFFRDVNAALALGVEHHMNVKGGPVPKYGQYVSVYEAK